MRCPAADWTRHGDVHHDRVGARRHPIARDGEVADLVRRERARPVAARVEDPVRRQPDEAARRDVAVASRVVARRRRRSPGPSRPRGCGSFGTLVFAIEILPVVRTAVTELHDDEVRQPSGSRTKLRFDAFGRRAPAGYTVRWPAAVGAVTVTFITTASTPAAGTPPCPATGEVARASLAPNAPEPSVRVSRIRAGGKRGERPGGVRRGARGRGRGHSDDDTERGGGEADERGEARQHDNPGEGRALHASDGLAVDRPRHHRGPALMTG